MVQPEAGGGTINTQGPYPTLDHLLQMVLQSLEAPAGAVALLDADTGELVTRVARGFGGRNARPARLDPYNSVEGWVLNRLEPALVEDAASDARCARTPLTPLRSALCAPLLAGDRLLGTLLVADEPPRAFGPRQRTLLLTLADMLALALAGETRSRALGETNHRLAIALETSRALAQAADAGGAFASVNTTLRRVLDCEDAVLYLYDADADVLRAGTAPGARLKPFLAPTIRADAPRSLVAWVARERRARVFAPGDDADAAFAEVAAVGGQMAILCAPLQARGWARGALFLARPQPFRAGDLDAALTLGDLFAATLATLDTRNTRDTRDGQRVPPAGAPPAARNVPATRAADHHTDHSTDRTMDHAKASFLSMVSHELRTPLQAINGYLDLALAGEGGALNEQHTEFVRRARAGSERLTGLVDDLLLLSRRDAGQLNLVPRPIDLAPVIRETVEELEILATDAGVRLEAELSDALPRIAADGQRITQVVRNLVSNAVKFTPAGGRVVVAAEATVEHVVLRVSDTGIGIPAEQRDRIFEPFYQVETSQGETSAPRDPQHHAQHHGQGLGLAIVRIIVQGHGGTIQVEGAPDGGSTFTVLLPRLTGFERIHAQRIPPV